MRICFHELAKYDLDDAIEWYDLQLPGLGDRFKNALRQTVDKIGGHPFWFPHEEDGIYKAYIPKFPYKVLFTIDADGINVWAIAHMHRKPGYWQNRH
jgi:plasmid stabilization system protein ParE